jgi:uncharacterized protein
MRINKFTFIGLFISYFSILFTGLLFKAVFKMPLGNGLTISKEVIIFGLVGLLLWIIIKKEQLPLDSIGIREIGWRQTAIWTIITGLLCLVGLLACLAIIQAIGWEYGKTESPVKLSMLTTTLVMLRAGIAEEVFFRGYIYERLKVLLKNKWIAIAFSIIPFALFHYSQGLPGIFISLGLGGILTAMYLWKRNLKANMIAHFLIDFIPNVLIPVFIV